MAHDHLPPAHRPSEGDGYDAPHGWDMAIDVVPEEVAPELFDPELLEGADAGIEWGSEGALARALFSAAISDVAPSGVRERVLSAVDTVLSEPVAVPAFPADAAPVTTLSGVFEKRRPTTEAASCIGACHPPVARTDILEDAVLRDGLERDGARHAVEQPVASEGVDSHEHATVGSASTGSASTGSASTGSVPAGRVDDACSDVGTPEVVALELVAPDVAAAAADISAAAESASSLEPPDAETTSKGGRSGLSDAEGEVFITPPLCATAAGGVHCCGGPMVGGRCRSKAHAMHTAAGPIINPVATPLSGRRFALQSEPGALVPARNLPACNVAVASNLDAALTAAERSTSARLRDGVVASAFNFAHLAAAIVVGIVIGKAAHLVMAGDSAVAWNATAEAEAGLRAEPSRTPDEVRASDPVEASVPPASLEPRSARSTPRPHAGSVARGSLRANASVRAARGATVPPSATVPSSSGAPQPANLATVAPALLTPLSVELGPRSRPSPAAHNIQPPLAPASDDWLGEQLAILGRAERSLLEDDPESAVRSLDEYKARFPDGLLDPQMASIRQRVEERFTAFIFP